MCQEAAETGLFQKVRQPRTQGDSSASDGLNHGVVLQHKQTEWKQASDSKRVPKTVQKLSA